ncbi:MAG: glutaredoxin family protein [Verrucomicrobiales bacterium]|nr:glutaredoxin family protein [Verrucomicrobiales bacterium]
MTESPELKVYIKPGCPWCVEAVAFLRKEEIDFEEIDVIGNPDKFREMQEISGQTYAPTLSMHTDGGDAILADFDVGELKEFFTEHGVEWGDS